MPITLETAVALVLGDCVRARIFDREMPAVFACARVDKDAAAAHALWDHAYLNDADGVTIREAGAIPPLVGFL